MLEVQHAFLRRLEEYQLVRPQRSAGGQRRYSRRDIEHLQQVVGLIEEGMSLVAVRRILYLQRQLTSARRQRDHLRRDAPARNTTHTNTAGSKAMQIMGEHGRRGTQAPGQPL